MKRFILIAVLSIALVPARHALADWPYNGIQPFGPDAKTVGQGVFPDGNGGAMVFGEVYVTGGTQMQVQRINSDGTFAWPSAAAASTASYGGKSYATAVSDGAGGLIVAWTITGNDGYAQRVNANGQAMWANGVKMYDACCAGPALVSVGDGSLVAFFQFASFIGMQIIGPNGAPFYPLTGHQVATTKVSQTLPDLRATSDGAGGYVVMWKYLDIADGIDDWHAQRVDADGNPLWGPSGIIVNDYPSVKSNPNIAPDGTGGFVAVWQDERGGGYNQEDIYAQHIDASGNRTWLIDGLKIAGRYGRQAYPLIRSVGGGYWVVTWSDSYSAQPGMYAQRIAPNGIGQWGTDGVRVLSKRDSRMWLTHEGSGRTLVAVFQFGSLWMNRVDVTGSSMWGGEKEIMNSLPGYDAPAVSAVDAGHAFALTSPDAAGRVQRVDLLVGETGRPEPGGVVAADNPSDQGGAVLVQWDASQADTRSRTLVTEYAVYMSPAGMQTWQEVGTQPPRAAQHYGLIVPTPADDVPYDWMVRTRTAVNWVYWDSTPSSAASIDNLAPAPPVSLSAVRGVDGVSLTWRAGDEDAVAYRVFRRTSAGVSPTDENRLAVVSGTDFTDTAPPPDEAFYVVTAVDAGGRTSAPSNEASAPTENNAGTPGFARLTLGASTPNPTAGPAVLRIGLPAAGPASIEIFDVAGRRVAAWRESGLEAGWNAVSFAGRSSTGHLLPGGVYFWRVTAASESVTRKLVIQR